MKIPATFGIVTRSSPIAPAISSTQSGVVPMIMEECTTVVRATPNVQKNWFRVMPPTPKPTSSQNSRPVHTEGELRD